MLKIKESLKKGTEIKYQQMKLFRRVLQNYVKTDGTANGKSQNWYKCKYNPKIVLLSPGIDDSSNIYRSTRTVTPERINPKKKELTEIRKYPKIDFGGTYYDNRESDSHPNKSGSQHVGSD